MCQLNFSQYSVEAPNFGSLPFLVDCTMHISAYPRFHTVYIFRQCECYKWTSTLLFLHPSHHMNYGHFPSLWTWDNAQCLMTRTNHATSPFLFCTTNSVFSANNSVFIFLSVIFMSKVVYMKKVPWFFKF